MLSIPCGLTGLEVRGEVEQAVEEVGGEGDTGEEEEEDEEWPSIPLFMSVREWRAASGPELPPVIGNNNNWPIYKIFGYNFRIKQVRKQRSC
jgi:hypothetical protein